MSAPADDAGPTDEELSAKIRELVPTVDLATTGLKLFTKLLSKEFGGVNLKSRSGYIRQVLEDAINELDDSDDDEEEEDNGSEDGEDDQRSDEETERPTKRQKGSSSTSGDGGGGGGGRQSGLTAKKKISDKLAKFLGRGEYMARTEVVKVIWDYIKENKLQNPSNKKEIILDQAMREVFGNDVQVFTMFTMQKYIGAHIEPFKPVDLTKNSENTKAKTKAKKSGKDKATEKKKGKAKGLQPPYRLSDDLAAIVGTDILPRPQVVSAIWEYIKGNGLQNPDDKRQIICDEKLKKVMKKARVNMFEMQRCLTPHLIEKVDKSAYQFEEEEVQEDSGVGDEG